MLGQSVTASRYVDCIAGASRSKSSVGRVKWSELVTKTESCLSTTDQVNGQGTVAKVCQALTHTKSSEHIDEARALSCP